MSYPSPEERTLLFIYIQNICKNALPGQELLRILKYLGDFPDLAEMNTNRDLLYTNSMENDVEQYGKTRLMRRHQLVLPILGNFSSQESMMINAALWEYFHKYKDAATWEFPLTIFPSHLIPRLEEVERVFKYSKASYPRTVHALYYKSKKNMKIYNKVMKSIRKYVYYFVPITTNLPGTEVVEAFDTVKLICANVYKPIPIPPKLTEDEREKIAKTYVGAYTINADTYNLAAYLTPMMGLGDVTVDGQTYSMQPLIYPIVFEYSTEDCFRKLHLLATDLPIFKITPAQFWKFQAQANRYMDRHPHVSLRDLQKIIPLDLDILENLCMYVNTVSGYNEIDSLYHK